MANRKYTLGELCTITKGITGIQKAIAGEYPLVVTSEERKSHNEFQFDDEAVIVPLVSGTGHGHASIKRIHYQTGKFALGSILCAIIPKDKSILNSAYLFRFLNLNKENELVARMKGMANVTLPIKEIAKIEIPLPSLADQLEFVEKYNLLETDSRLIELEFQEQISLVKQLRQAFLFEAMQGKLCHPKTVEDHETGEQLLALIKAEKDQQLKDKKISKEKGLPPITQEEMPFEIPKDWVWCRIGDLVQHNSGKTLDSGRNKGKMRDYITTSNLYWGYFKLDKVKQIAIEDNELDKCTAVFGDLLICEGGEAGRCAIWKEKYDICFQNHIHRIRPSSNISNLFIYYFINYLNFSGNINTYRKGMGISNMSSKSLSSIKIPLPPLSMQNQIASKLDELMKACDELESSIKQSQLQNEQLLQQVLKETLAIKGKPARNAKLAIPDNRKNFAKQVLGGKIISLFKDDPNFTHIKLQKLQYLSEHIAEADLGSDYYFQTAGPYDNKFMHSIAINLERSKWFKEENYRYYPLEKVDQIDQYYEGYFAPVSDKLSNLFNLLANSTEAFSEIIATLYAVWNNRIIRKEELTDELLIVDFYSWSDRKRKYSEDELKKGLEIIRANNIEPRGFGKQLKRAKGK
ncbi:restriction endonuclease subunit S [Pedobacter terrae]|uniref:restriction endonuclease subunit S n=1 Tax=Pedobacter terrae TaxID=405671 RepID=UPI002FFCC6D3